MQEEASDVVEIAADLDLTLSEDRQTLFERNMAAFKQRMPAIYSLLSTHQPVSELQVNDDDFNVLFEGKPLFDRGARGEADYQHENLSSYASRLFITIGEGGIDPHTMPSYNRILEKTEKSGLNFAEESVREESYFVMVFGVGLGQHLDRLIEYSNCRSLALIEPNADFLYHSCFTYDWAALMERMQGRGSIDFYLGNDPLYTADQLHLLFRRHNPMSVDGTLVFRHYKSSIVRGVERRLAEKIGTAVMGLGFFQDEVNMMAQTYKNLEGGETRLIRKITESPGVPCFVCGNGPSLEGLIPFIKKNQDNVVIVAGGSALETLLDHGVQPDFWVMMERGDLVLKLVQETAAKHDLSDIRFIGSTTVFPQVPDFFKDPIFFFRPGLSPAPLFSTSDEQMLMLPDPLSANACVAAVSQLGFRDIYMVGVDVGSRKADEGHVPGGWYNRLDDYIKNMTIAVRGNFGGEIWTMPVLQWSQNNIERQIMTVRGRNFFNLSDGAFIEGAKPLHHRAAKIAKLNEPKENKIEKIIESCPVYPKSEFERRWEEVALIDKFDDMRAELKEVVRDMSDFNFEFRLSQILKPAESADPLVMLVRGTLFTIAIVYVNLNNRIRIDAEREVFESIIKEEFEIMVDLLFDRATEVFLDVEAGEPWTESFVF